MAALTRSNIAYDLTISPHSSVVDYGGEKIEFVFSSALYKSKFEEKRNEHRAAISESLSKRFGVPTRQDLLADFKLYTTIEKRGFLLRKNEVEITWQSGITLDGGTLTLASSDE